VDVLFFATKNNTFLDVLFSQFCYVIIILLNTYKRSFTSKYYFWAGVTFVSKVNSDVENRKSVFVERSRKKKD
jgi:hypothetical protein